jgi:hypothetical protein
LAIGRTVGDGEFLSSGAIDLYGAYTRQDWRKAQLITDEYPGAHAELLALNLIHDDPDRPGRPVVRNPKRALETILFAELEEARKRVAFMSGLWGLTNQLAGQYAATQWRPGRSSEYLDEQAAVNARIQDIVGGARREILAAQPGGPRNKDILEMTMQRDSAALARGVALRTIYRNTVRDHPVTAEYVRALSTWPSGIPAQYRTMPGAFERVIIVDREHAFITDHIVGGPEHAAWHVTDRAVIAVFANIFENRWINSDPWTGELRSRRGKYDADAVSGNGARTSRWQRQILRYLSAGVSQPAIARRIGVSKRKLEDEIVILKGLWGVSTLNELVYQWALSQDRLVDDDAPVTADSPATAGRAAV